MLLKKAVLLLIVVLALGGGGLAYAASNAAPAPQDILNRAVTALQAAQDGHAILQIQGTSSSQSGSATVEVWGKKLSSGNPPTYAFHGEVRQASDARAQGAVAVSDGQQVWLYAPSQNTVWTGTVQQMENGNGFSFSSPQQIVQQILDYATVTLAGTETVQGHTAYKLQLVPQSSKVPAAVAGASGLLWIDTGRWLPLQASFNAGSMGQGQVTATLVELNIGVPDSLFQFQIPQGATVVPLQNQQPQHMSIGTVDTAAGFHVLQPSTLPSGATLVDVLKTGQTIVLRYEAASGSFAIAQGLPNEMNTARAGGSGVSVRGTSGTVFTSDAGKGVLLVWTENGRTYSISGALSSQDALRMAESLQ